MPAFTKSTYSGRVAELIKSRIRSRRYSPGESLSEASLAEECGISRAPVREALHLLETEGLLMSHPKRGKCVTVLTPERLRDSYELSALLEAGAAVRAADGLPKTVQKRLQALLEEMRETASSPVDIEAHARLSSAFHQTVLSLTDNAMLPAFADRFSRVISKYLLYQEWRSIYSPHEQYQRHKAIYDALLTARAENIREAVYRHYAESAERMAAFCTPAEDPGKRRAHFPDE